NVPKVQPNLAFWGTDLGWTVAHKGEVQILFGDTDDTFDSVCRGQLQNDDSQGVIPLQPPPRGVPPLTFLTQPNDPNVLERIFVFRDGESLQMGYGQVPVAAYSDGQNLVAIMGRGGTIPCKAGVDSPVAACHSPLEDHPARSNWISADGLRCSQSVGECIPAPNGISTPCELATGAGCNPALGEACRPTAAGLCVDPSSSQNDALRSPRSTPPATRWSSRSRIRITVATTNPSRPCGRTSSSTQPR